MGGVDVVDCSRTGATHTLFFPQLLPQPGKLLLSVLKDQPFMLPYASPPKIYKIIINNIIKAFCCPSSGFS